MKDADGNEIEPLQTETPAEADLSMPKNPTPVGLEDGRAFIQNIVSDPPQPVPGLMDKLRADASTETADAVKGKTAAEQGNAAAESIRVNPADWKHLKDHKNRPFDPERHKVNLDGSPVIGTKNRLQCLKKGDKNPVQVILSAFSADFEEVEIETQDEAHVQAKAVIDQGRIRRKSKRLVRFYFMGGCVLWGLRFAKGKNERAPALEEELTDVMIETGKELDVPAPLVTIGAFVGDFEDMLWRNFGENPEQGVIKKFLLRRLPFIRWAIRGGKKKKQEETANIEGAE